MNNNILLKVDNLKKDFTLTQGLLEELQIHKGKITRKKEVVHAVNGVSFHISKGEVFSLVGESGCGKSTTARMVVRLIEPTEGNIYYEGENITNLEEDKMMPYRKKMQMIFQNPYASLNPRHTIERSLTEPMLFNNVAKTGKEAKERASNLLEKVGLYPEYAKRYPHQFSGGQRQRIAIARALAMEPEFIVADEPVSALDVSVQAQILNLLMDLKEELNLSYLFIAHDLAVVKHISDRLGIMYLGKIVEMGKKEEIYSNPLHPYTKVLFSAVPILGKKNVRNVSFGGDVPTPTNMPKGCIFGNRCPHVEEICFEEPPEMKSYGNDHFACCHKIDKIS